MLNKILSDKTAQKNWALYKSLSIAEKLKFSAGAKKGADEILEHQKRLKSAVYKTKKWSRAKNDKFSRHAWVTHSTRHARFVMSLERQAWLEKDAREGNIRKISGVYVESSIKKFGDVYATIKRDISYDNNRYSKSWHRKYGGAKSISNTFFAVNAKTGEKFVNDVAGNKSIISCLIDNPLFLDIDSGHSLKMRLSKKCDCVLIKTVDNFEIYSRTLGGTHIDYVIKTGAHVTHSDDIDAGINSLKIKMGAQHDKNKKLIDFDYLRSLGFCAAGIRRFCDVFGCDIDAQYTIDQIKKMVRSAPDNAAPFLSELKTIGIRV